MEELFALGLLISSLQDDYNTAIKQRAEELFIQLSSDPETADKLAESGIESSEDLENKLSI